MAISIEKQLEQYTLQNLQEVLLVTVEIDGEIDEILVFRGFSSSLMRPTAADPDVPVLPDDAVITTIDRLASPYQPDCPNYLERQISWADFSQRLNS
ncbi:hypothetical protein D0962_11185 [Leptolyngbyaceae cyanobacterium CCMR0082]|uniref:DUF7734 domain-containing protein n=2 Tax=Adonisia turfae TaxID=2950184 RepID=A0A6M0S681_9CYAN|nr:hypothetical protein [Adonisia turfae]EKV01946.1 hypothetical protein Lepto7375DRAFT_4141 [Leptolyngbya sp. PCC 7375]MDV3350490.1 hypothetical protein [Leptothoe sp. LEGE 181152]NEZ55677.1 hypothetical protein [Adonisia turfae CCMR0081]NEZ63342.1 hypothetical protein [Adonisia turfae CCMR0082]